MTMDLKRLFAPSRIAVYGVSRTNLSHPANVIYSKNRLRRLTESYAINPKGGSLYGERLYENIGEIGKPIDAAVIAVRAELVADVVRECIANGVAGAVVVAGGFAETGKAHLEEEIRELALAHDFALIGPNCIGLWSPPMVDTLFLPPERLIDIRKGGISIISQSGGILVDLMIKLTQEGSGLAKGISIGNRAVLDEVDIARFLDRDPETKVIAVYIEGFKEGRGRAFADFIRRAKKPVVFLKSGKTPEGSKAVASHTASVAGDYKTLSDVLQAAGGVEAKNESDLIAFTGALDTSQKREMENVCIITASGGHGAIAGDSCYDCGLKLARIPEEAQAELRKRLTPAVADISSLRNPIDLTGSGSDQDFIETVRFTLARDEVGGAIILLMPYLPALTPDIGGRIAQACLESGKPTVVYMPHVDKYGIFIEGFEANGIPVSHSVRGAVAMAAALAKKERA